MGKTPIIPLSARILVIFISLILMSNFMTNLISIQMTQRQVIELTNKLTVTQLKDIYKNAQNQYQVYSYKHNKNECVQALESSAAEDFSNPNSLALAFDRTGKLFFYISASGMQR